MNKSKVSPEKYDIIIVGGGPAGLKCAHVLSGSDKRVLLLEKAPVFGDKLCAGGLTANDLKILDVPDSVIEHKISNTSLQSPKRKSTTQAPRPFLYTVNRKALGTWQRSLLDETHVVVRNNTQVTGIGMDHIELAGGERIHYTYLVGADGYNSIVRKFLGLPVQKKLIGIQYTIPWNIVDPTLEIHLDSKLFKAWYAWIFPHQDSIAVGCCSDPGVLPPAKLKQNFQTWLDKRGINYTGIKLQTYPISYDYRGIRYGNIFLVGEAAGMACGLTGEGIYQSLVSGLEAAHMILDPDHVPEQLHKAIHYNAVQHKIMRLFKRSHFIRNFLHELLLMAMNNQRVKSSIRRSFSPEPKKR